MLSQIIGASLLGNMLTRKGILRVGYGSKRISDSTSSFNNRWNSKVLSKWTQI